jgi:hypothetical protein
MSVAGWDDAVARGSAGPHVRVWDDQGGVPPVTAVLEAVDPALVERPGTPFVALHAALALAAAGDAARLRGLAQHCSSSADHNVRGVVVPVCRALVAVLDERWDGPTRRAPCSRRGWTGGPRPSTPGAPGR